MRKRLTLYFAAIALLAFSALPNTMTGQNRDAMTGTWSAIDGAYTQSGNDINFTIANTDGTVNLASGVLSKDNGQSIPAQYSNGFRLYAKNTISITPIGESAITRIEYTFYKQGSKAYAQASLTTGEGTFTSGGTPTTTEPVVDTWEGQVTNKAVTIKLGNSGQRLLDHITVTVQVSGAGQTYTVTYNPNGGTGTMAPQTYSPGEWVTVPACGFEYTDHVFDKWTITEQGSGNIYYPGNTFQIFQNTTFYAQWTYVGNGIVDALNPANVNAALEENNVPLNSYGSWRVTLRTGDNVASIFDGISNHNASAIQITNSTSGASKHSGIVTTVSKGKVTKVQVVWSQSTITGRTLQVYGRTTAYNSTEDLYNTNQGALLGTIVYGTSTELTITGDYPYIGLRSASGAMYFDEIRVFWENVTASPTIEFAPVAVNLGNVIAGSGASTTFTVSQHDLGDNIVLSTTDGTLDPATIERNAGPTNVTWTYQIPANTATGQQTITVTATSTWTDGDNQTQAVTKTLDITMTVLNTSNATSLSAAKNSFIENPSNNSAVISLTNVEVVGRHGNYLYLQDAIRGLLVYGALPATLSDLTKGCKFSGGVLTGTLTSYNGIIELVNFQFQAIENNITFNNTLTEVTVASLDMLNSSLNHEYEHRYVKVEGVTISIDNNVNWTVSKDSQSMALNDHLSVGYASKTAPEATDQFTVKGVYNPYYSSNQLRYELIPTAIADIHTSTTVGAPTFSLSHGTPESPTMATTVTLTPAANTTMVYSIDNRDNRYESNTAVTLNITGRVQITAQGTRDFYEPSAQVVGYYRLPDNVRAVMFSVNGTEVGPVYAAYNSNSQSYRLYDNQPPTVSDLGDFTFRGWSTSASSTATITFPFTITAGASETTTLYAVYGKATSHVYRRISSPSQITEGEYVIVGNNGQKDYVLKTDASSSHPTAYQLGDLGITVTEGVLNGALDNVVWNFTGEANAMTISSKANPSNYLYSTGSNTNVNIGNMPSNADITWYFLEDTYLNSTFNLRSNASSRYLTLYNGQDWRCYVQSNMYGSNCYPRLIPYKKMPNPTANDVRYTRIFINETAQAEITINGPSIIPSGSYLNMSTFTFNCTDENLFLIEDGAVFTPAAGNSSTIKATVQKAIAGYGNDDNVEYGWYLLGSPVGMVNANGLWQEGGGQATGFYSVNETNYDLYSFNPMEDQEWRNHKANGNSTVFGQWGGILYSSQTDRILTYRGTLVTSCNSQTLIYTGWNLIGNPFTCNATLSRDYYKLVEVEGASVLQPQAATEPVAPMEGIFVETTQANETFSFTPIATQGNTGNGEALLNITVEEGQGTASTLDRAMVRFGEGSMLGKFTFRDGCTMLYVPQGGKDYAVVRAQNKGEMPLHFKAAQNGTYTLSVKPQGVEMTYLHLIDNMTGDDIDLLATPTYTFTAKTTDYASRFRLMFSANNVEEDGPSAGSAAFAYFNGSNWVVSNPSTPSTGSGTGSGAATLQVVDVMGRIVANQQINGNATVNIDMPGVYVLRLVNGNDVKVQKVVVR